MRNTTRTRTIVRIVACLLALGTLVAVVLAGVLKTPAIQPGPTAAGATASHTPTSTRRPVNTTDVTVSAEAMGLLAQLVIAEEDTGAHYQRTEWGEDWAIHEDGCSTREQVLLRDSHGSAERGRGCTPICPAAHDGPCWTSPYDGATYRDQGGLQIDHVLAPKEVSRSRVLNADGTVGLGAGRVWRPDQRHRFYEDQRNLLAVTSKVNSSKNDKDPGRWRPALDSAWCTVATTTAHMKIEYRLTVDQAEHNALDQMLATCPASNG